MTLLLSRSTIDCAVDVDEALGVLEDGFRAAPAAHKPLRVRTGLPGPGTATCLMPGILPGFPAYTVKVNAKFPAASPALRGTLGEILNGDRPAREHSCQATVYAPIGLPWQDFALTWLVYRNTVATDRAPTIDLLS